MSDVELRPGGGVRGADLSDVDWADRDLADIELVDCVIRDAQLSGVVLQGARLTSCRLLRCRFAHADLREATFEGCTFADDEGHAGVEFAFSRLDEARFSDCDLSFARLERSSAYGLVCEDCNWRGATFAKADFERAFGRKVVRCEASFRRCNLELADLTGVRLPGADLSGCNLRETTLIEADLEGANLSGCDLFLAFLASAKLAEADLRGAEISGLTLTDLASWKDVRIAADQQYRLLSALGVDVQVE